MRNLYSLALAVCAACALVIGLSAADKDSSAKDSSASSAKEVTVKGKIVCAKCELQETKECVTAIQVKQDKKTITYYFDDEGEGAKYHGEICGGGSKDGSVTGVVTTKKDGKMWIKPTKVEYSK
jgi:hypothetical protein